MGDISSSLIISNVSLVGSATSNLFFSLASSVLKFGHVYDQMGKNPEILSLNALHQVIDFLNVLVKFNYQLS